jgi:hypothetical protein
MVVDPEYLFQIQNFPSWIEGQKNTGSRVRIRDKEVEVFLTPKNDIIFSEILSGIITPNPNIPGPDPGF